MTQRVAIIGAGPAGLIAAETLAKAGVPVDIYDAMPSPGRKFLMAGRGGLNLTHSEPLPQFLKRYGAAEQWLTPSIQNFTPEALRQWCEGLGEETFVGSSGRVFPRSMKAAPLLRAWLKRLGELGVSFHARHRFMGWESGALLLQNAAQQKIMLQPSATIFALGGASWPRLGSDGSWAEILAAQGVKLAPFAPSNMGVTTRWSAYFASRFAGQPLKPLAITLGHTRQQGEAIITAHGIEGGIVYALSFPLRDAIRHDGYARIQLDLRPAMTVEALAAKLTGLGGSKSLSTILKSAKFSALDGALLHELVPAETLKTMNAMQLAAQLKALPLTLRGHAGLARAISTAGGITRDAMTDDLMLRALPGVFAAGEMLDWEAPTGGYLLQACFSTGVTAAQGALHYLKLGDKLHLAPL